MPKSIAGPRGRLLLGSIPDFFSDPTGFLLRVTDKYGGLVRLRLGPGRTVLVSEPRYVKHVLQDNSDNYIRGRSVQAGRFFLGDGLGLLDGDAWRRERRLMQPAFHRRQLLRLVGQMHAPIDTMLDGWAAAMAAERPVDIAADMHRLTLTIVIRAMFGDDVGDDVAPLAAAFNRVQAYLFRSARNPFLPPRWVPTPANRALRRAIGLIDATVYDVIARRRARHSDAAEAVLLDMLLDAAVAEDGPGLSDRQLRDEAVMLFFAGHETTAAALAWTWHLLLTHPNVEARVRAELAAVVGEHAPAAADLPRLRYLRQVLDESMRLYAPVWMYGRQAVSADEIDGYRIPAGATVMLSPFVTHRDPALWPDPDRFDPDRFLPEAIQARPKYAYYPFGGGRHLCIGNHFAVMEAQLVLAQALRRFQLRSVADHPVEPLAEATLKLKYGLPAWVAPAPVVAPEMGEAVAEGDVVAVTEVGVAAVRPVAEGDAAAPAEPASEADASPAADLALAPDSTPAADAETVADAETAAPGTDSPRPTPDDPLSWLDELTAGRAAISSEPPTTQGRVGPSAAAADTNEEVL